MGAVELKDYVNNEEFIEKMNQAFSDLRADYELSMDADRSKIEELVATHVDLNNQLANLIAYSTSSSGVISGLRGTGKTHLMLLARHSLNNDCFAGKSTGVFCIYLNVKRLNLPETFNQDLFNRIFSVFIYNEIAKQLTAVLEQLKDEKPFEKLLSMFNNNKKQLIKSLQSSVLQIIKFQGIAHNGNSLYNDLSVGTSSETKEYRDLIELTQSFNSRLDLTDAEIGSTLSAQKLDEISEQLSNNNTYIKYLSTNTIREELISLMKNLKLKGITFYIDEWEKISYNPDLQRFMSFYIDRILDDPIYCWISVVPYRGSLYYLDKGADLQHSIDLDENLVYENSKKDQELCASYFRAFVEKRLLHYFDDAEINVNLLFNNQRNFEKLVLASMGNSRDFGTMLLQCWSEYRAYRIRPLAPGRPYQYISEPMVLAAIKNNGETKLSNLADNQNAQKVWNYLESFCIGKKSSHFAIKENQDNIDALSRIEFSDLIYHRLIHLRKRHVPAKDSSVESKLSIYALDYSSTYNLHSNERKFQFITNDENVHNRVRRYIYNPTTIISKIRIQAGEIFPCISCGEGININKMTAAWNSNSCPYCGMKIRNN